MKTCTKCKLSKPEGEFSKHKRSSDGLKGWCKKCCNEANKKYHPAGDRNASLLSKHNITKEMYDKLLADQKGVCAACKSSDPKSRWGVFCVDHDHACCPGPHSCGLCIRGLLCFKCNAALGNVGDESDVLLALIQYLKDHPLPDNLAQSKEILLIQKRKDSERRKEQAAKKIGISNTGKKKTNLRPRKKSPMTENHRKNVSKGRLAYFAENRAA